MTALEPGPGETLDRIAGDWSVFQLARGHRFSSDDMLCAWAAARARPDALRVLDLGAGIGSVGLMTLWKLPPAARLLMVEAQRISHDLACRSIAFNGLGQRVEARHGDLREPESLEGAGRFDLVCCSPPYIPPGHGVLSPVPQRAGARIELRGDVFDYLRVARAHLALGGRVSLVFAAVDERPARAMAAAGLGLVSRTEVFFRSGRPASLALTVYAHRAEAPLRPRCTPPWVLRDAKGRFTDGYRHLRAEMGHG